MSEKSIFSVITVARNNLSGLKKTTASLQNQTCHNYEWIVIDGASTDGTPAWLANVPAQWVSEPDGGIYDAMNKGIERAQGDYLLFLNGGDKLATPETLQSIENAILAREPALDFIYGDSFEDSTYKPARPHKTKDWGMFTHHQAMLYRRDALNGLRYDLRYEIAADYDFTYRFLNNAAQHILYCPLPFCVFESGGVSQQKALKGRQEQREIRSHLQTPPAKNALIYGLQSAAWNFRRRAPQLYWAMKSGGNRRNGSGRN